jgi:hypothetical protein
MDVHDQPHNPQGPVPEDVSTHEAGQNEDDAEEEGQGRYWLFNLLELLTPMPDYDDEDDEPDEDRCEQSGEAEVQGEDTSG